MLIPSGCLLKLSSYAAALYLINENQEESFKEKFTDKKKFTEGRSVYYLYKIDKPTTNENLWCYALPF